MLIHRQAIYFADELVEIRAEPVWEAGSNILQGFRFTMPRGEVGYETIRRQPASAGMAGHCQGDPIIKRAGHERRLAVARMTSDEDLGYVNLRHSLLQRVDDPRDAPG